MRDTDGAPRERPFLSRFSRLNRTTRVADIDSVPYAEWVHLEKRRNDSVATDEPADNFARTASVPCPLGLSVRSTTAGSFHDISCVRPSANISYTPRRFWRLRVRGHAALVTPHVFDRFRGVSFANSCARARRSIRRPPAKPPPESDAFLCFRVRTATTIIILYTSTPKFLIETPQRTITTDTIAIRDPTHLAHLGYTSRLCGTVYRRVVPGPTNNHRRCVGR